MSKHAEETLHVLGARVRHSETGKSGQVIAMRPWSPAFLDVIFDGEKSVRPVWHSDLETASDG